MKTAARARRARPGFGRGSLIESVHLQRVRVRDRCLARTRTWSTRMMMNACTYILRAHVQRHQFRERLRLAKSLEFGGVRRLRLANGKRGPHAGGDLRVETNERTRRLVSLSLTRTLSLRLPRRFDARMNGVSIRSSAARVPRVALVAIAPSRVPPRADRSTNLSPSRASPRRRRASPASVRPSVRRRAIARARTKHIKNTLGPYSQSLSPGGAFTLYTTPSRMNMTSAHENMNHTVTCRPRNVLFSSSSLVTMVLDSTRRRPSSAVCRRPSSVVAQNRRAPRRLAPSPTGRGGRPTTDDVLGDLWPAPSRCARGVRDTVSDVRVFLFFFFLVRDGRARSEARDSRRGGGGGGRGYISDRRNFVSVA